MTPDALWPGRPFPGSQGVWASPFSELHTHLHFSSLPQMLGLWALATLTLQWQLTDPLAFLQGSSSFPNGIKRCLFPAAGNDRHLPSLESLDSLPQCPALSAPEIYNLHLCETAEKGKGYSPCLYMCNPRLGNVQ